MLTQSWEPGGATWRCSLRPRGAQRGTGGVSPAPGGTRGVWGPSPEQRKGARSLALTLPVGQLPPVGAEHLVSAWLTARCPQAARQRVGTAVWAEGEQFGARGLCFWAALPPEMGQGTFLRAAFSPERGLYPLALLGSCFSSALARSRTWLQQRCAARAAAGEVLLRRLPPSSPSQGVPGDKAPPGCSPRPPLALQGGRGAQQPPWEGLSALQLAAGRLAPPAPAAGAGLRSLLHLAWVPECFGKALTPDPQYKLSPARGREKLLPDLQAPGFTSCLQ